MKTSDQLIKQRILQTLQNSKHEEHDTYVNLYEILPSLSISFLELKRVAVLLANKHLIETTEISGVRHLLLAKITESGSAEYKRLTMNDQSNWDKQVKYWIRASIMGSTVVAMIALIGFLVTTQQSSIQPFQAELGDVIQTLSADDEMAKQTLLQYLYLQQGLTSAELSLELVISEGNTKRFLVRCINSANCQFSQRLVSLIKEDDHWIIEYEEDLRKN